MDDLGMEIHHDGTRTTLTFRGVLASDDVDEFDEALVMAIETNPTELRVDTTGLRQIEFEGVIALLRGARWCGESEITFHLVPGKIVNAAIEIAGLSWLVDAALASRIDRDHERSLHDQARDRLVRTPYLI